jgi:sarcosine oxidase subunit gamma
VAETGVSLGNVNSASTRVTFRARRIGWAWNVRGDATDGRFVATVQRVLAPLPMRAMTSTRTPDAAMLWLGPRTWLHVGAESGARRFDDARRAINAAGGALFDVSAGYVGWSIEGAQAARVLNRECPLDLRPGAFPAGHCAQSLLGHTHALIHRPRESPAFIVLVGRSFGADAWHLLQTAATTEGHVLEAPIEFDAV